MPFDAAVAGDVLQVNTQSLPYFFQGNAAAPQTLLGPLDCSQFTTYTLLFDAWYPNGAAPGLGVISVDVILQWYVPNPVGAPGALFLAAQEVFEITCGINGSFQPVTIQGLTKGTVLTVTCGPLNATVTPGNVVFFQTCLLNLSTIPVDKSRAFPQPFQAGFDETYPPLTGTLAAAASSGLRLVFPLSPGTDLEVVSSAGSATTNQFRFEYQWGNTLTTPLIFRSLISGGPNQISGLGLLQLICPNRPLLVNVVNTGTASATYNVLAWAKTQ